MPSNRNTSAYVERNRLIAEAEALAEHGIGKVRFFATDLAGRLTNCRCENFYGTRCWRIHTCPNCNYHYQRRRWFKVGRRKTSALLALGATPLWFRGSVNEDNNFEHALASLLKAAEAFCLPFTSAYTSPANDPRSRALVSGMYGIHIAKGEHGWHLHIHAVLWLRPGTRKQVEMIKSLLTGHWIASSGCGEGSACVRRMYQHKQMEQNIERAHSYMTKLYPAMPVHELMEVQAAGQGTAHPRVRHAHEVVARVEDAGPHGHHPGRGRCLPQRRRDPPAPIGALSNTEEARHGPPISQHLGQTTLTRQEVQRGAPGAFVNGEGENRTDHEHREVRHAVNQGDNTTDHHAAPVTQMDLVKPRTTRSATSKSTVRQRGEKVRYTAEDTDTQADTTSTGTG